MSPVTRGLFTEATVEGNRQAIRMSWVKNLKVTDLDQENDTQSHFCVFNFGVGIRGCLGRFYAKEFIKGFFEDFIKDKILFKPNQGHLYSGRDNDNYNLSESVYQIKVLYRVLRDELIRNLKIRFARNIQILNQLELYFTFIL